MIFNRRLKEENERLCDKLRALNFRVWKLENKPKYEIGVLCTSNNSYIVGTFIESKHFKNYGSLHELFYSVFADSKVIVLNESEVTDYIKKQKSK